MFVKVEEGHFPSLYHFSRNATHYTVPLLKRFILANSFPRVIYYLSQASSLDALFPTTTNVTDCFSPSSRGNQSSNEGERTSFRNTPETLGRVAIDVKIIRSCISSRAFQPTLLECQDPPCLSNQKRKFMTLHFSLFTRVKGK